MLLQDVVDNAFCAVRNPPSHTMQPLIYKGIYHLHRVRRLCQHFTCGDCASSGAKSRRVKVVQACGKMANWQVLQVKVSHVRH